MLTLFTTLKPMRGQFAIIQRNALRSWCRITPKPKIIIFDDSDGAEALALEIHAHHVPEIRCNTKDIPLVKHMFARAAAIADTDLIIYANADMILPPNMQEIVNRIDLKVFLGVGRRTDLALTDELDFASGWHSRLQSIAVSKGKLHGDYGIDYFILPRLQVSELDMPDFAIGRPCWDNWLIFRAASLGIPVIDFTPSVLAIHQEHDYTHHPDGIAGVHYGKDARENLAFAGGRDYLFSIADADLILTDSGIFPNRTITFSRKLRNFSVKHEILGAPLRLFRYLLGKRKTAG